MKEPSARVLVRGWLRQHMEAERKARGGFELPTVVDAAVAHFKPQAEVVEVFLRECFRPLVYDEAQRMVGSDRQRDDADALIVTGDKVVSRQALAAKATAFAKRWEHFTEHAGERHVVVFEMTKADLLTAADARERQAQPHLVYARLWRNLAADLQDGQRVRDRFSALELERRYQVVKAEVLTPPPVAPVGVPTPTPNGKARKAHDPAPMPVGARN
jgi:hypothetical protein